MMKVSFFGCCFFLQKEADSKELTLKLDLLIAFSKIYCGIFVNRDLKIFNEKYETFNFYKG